ncbi:MULTISPECIES: hypothetical protein [unclassified Chelatococcus]|uniref:hypothetical protein n=1 Tax=unclassified Chelatococcus TaxID=2638111 RepID=UPI001BCC7CA4|nr:MULTISPECIES: hypothetical protein [unclassified Chelatococcus]CAH1658939.1 hypothetical protein CHELA41_21620 [Hyphomicrobiales bacterium]MBS7738868.1 hypothetical protein [Chelatococcus sp. HY11]MBS7740868.1 hypothetical protein [Chelatococcus sp. HY11]MCO5076604.1 hypothetical protein [Chelatococcus sp.]MCO5079970.1 hypothetical protein [Chelatococcus sp.]
MPATNIDVIGAGGLPLASGGAGVYVIAVPAAIVVRTAVVPVVSPALSAGRSLCVTLERG